MRLVRYYMDKRPNKEFAVEIEIDVDTIARVLATRVLNSTRGKTVAMRGAIKAKRVPDNSVD